VTVSSEPGKGARCRIRLPLTMAIIEGLVLRASGQTFVLPLVSIVESFSPGPTDVRTIAGHSEVVRLRGEVLPLLRLASIFGLQEAEQRDDSQRIITVIDAGGVKIGLSVDELLGQAQVVIKSLEANYKRIEGVAAATILGDGTVALILDAHALATLAKSRGRAAPPPPSPLAAA